MPQRLLVRECAGSTCTVCKKSTALRFTLETLHGASELPEVLSRPDGNTVPVGRIPYALVSCHTCRTRPTASYNGLQILLFYELHLIDLGCWPKISLPQHRHRQVEDCNPSQLAVSTPKTSPAEHLLYFAAIADETCSTENITHHEFPG